ncbi:MAG: ATP synthase F1 subunit delta [Caldilineae bacterium]|nr:ATP synthase F1 subunit delta [Anaerolineae bacterium]MCB0198655.1 ATP synthase F1 subunit delta [Anaerolineae bacterium]MCB0204395.1 ATP synthase F1 subunit delta [Anaerolineae bacterium]MCB9143599.1 ATP synthase F1 subunit delta [Anaerolineales bacterium]MCB9155142.1 ATP synthase F1 subunit delta [Caldilineae bacterium]
MSASSEVQVYTQAAFETAIKDWLTNLEHIAGALDRSPDLLKRLADDASSFEVRQAVLTPLMREDIPAPVRNFVFGMLANGDVVLLNDVVTELHSLGAAIGGPKAVVAEVTSAVELTSEERAAIEKRLVDQFGLGLDFRFNVDPDILGGLLIRVGDKLLDTSVASRLVAMRQSLGLAAS